MPADEPRAPHPLTVAGAAQVGRCFEAKRTFLLPVELRSREPRRASTNCRALYEHGGERHGARAASYNPANARVIPFMSAQPLIEQVAERVERLLLRHAELRRTNELLTQQVQALTHERDNLKSRLLAARARVDALIDRLPGPGTGAASDGGADSTERAS